MTVPDGYNIQPTGPMIGADDANNEFASSNVVPNADGSALERLEYIQTQIAAEAVKTTALQADTVNIPNVASKVLATIANGSTTLFNYTGTVKINSIVGRVTTVCEAKGTNYKLSVVSDALGAVDICADLDLTAAVVGTLLSITGTAANAMVGSANGAIAPGQANPVFATCTTGGIIKAVSGAANTGAITWLINWEPLSAGATLTAA